MPKTTCLICSRRKAVADKYGLKEWCRRCTKRYPAALRKAVVDSSYSYHLALSSGEIVHFEGALIVGRWVVLTQAEWVGDNPENLPKNYMLERGLNVRIKHIVWCLDDPS